MVSLVLANLAGSAQLLPIVCRICAWLAGRATGDTNAPIVRVGRARCALDTVTGHCLAKILHGWVAISANWACVARGKNQMRLVLAAILARFNIVLRHERAGGAPHTLAIASVAVQDLVLPRGTA
jgi:hypothetical protein